MSNKTKKATLSIAAPSGPFDHVLFRKAITQLKKHFFVSYPKAILTKKAPFPFLVADDRQRAQMVIHALTDPRSKVVLFARGGYGCQRLLPLLDRQLPAKLPPKLVIGSSDLTILLNYLWKRYHKPSLYGPMVAPHFHREENIVRLKKILLDPKALQRQSLTAQKVLRPGHAEGTLMGGCLTLIVASLGTPWEMETEGKILFLEDTHEEDYAVDRMLTQLDQAGKLRNLKGIVLGTFRQKKILFPKSVEKVFMGKFRSFKGPVLWGLRFGHCPDPRFIPLGTKAKISGKQLVLTEEIMT